MIKLETISLDNGLKIFILEDKRRHSVFFQHITLFGGETKDFIYNGKEYSMNDGVAHILEHYVVEENTKGNFLEILGKKQMNTNASTYRNMTKYYFETVEDVIFGIKTLLEGIYSVEFTEEKVNKIKEPIYQEIRARLNDKFYHSENMIKENLFKKIHYKNIAGSIEEVKAVTWEDLKNCYEAFYQPKNQYIVVAGNFDKEEVVNCIKEFFKDKKFNNEKAVELIDLKEDNEVKKKTGVVYFPTAQDFVEIVYKINIGKMNCREKLDLDFYINIFLDNYFGVTSKIYNELVKDKIITGGISRGYHQCGNFFLVRISAYTDKKQIFIKKITEAIRKMDKFDEEFFELEKKQIIMSVILRDEQIFDMVIPFVDNLVNFNYPYLDTVDDISRLHYKNYVEVIKNLDFNNYTVVTIKNKEKEA